MNVEHRNARSIETRQARAFVRRALVSGSLTIEDVLTDHIGDVRNIPLFLLMTWRRGWGKDRQRIIAARAIRDQINLGFHAGDASRRTLDWLIEQDRLIGNLYHRESA